MAASAENELGNDVSTDEASVTETDAQDASAQPPDDPLRLNLNVEIDTVGPCKKHIRVTVPREDIDHIHRQAVSELSAEASVPGFRPGKVPQKLLERRFRDELSGQVKQKVLIESLEQLAEDNDLDPINEPDLDVENIEIPETGDFEFEFDVEVRPEFELPEYRGLKIERPSKDIDEDDVLEFQNKYLRQYGALDSVDGPAQPGDQLVLDVTSTHEGETLNRSHNVTVDLASIVRFPEGELTDFDKLMEGVSKGDVREADVLISDEAENSKLRGEKVHLTFHVEDVRRAGEADLDKEMLQRIGVETVEELQEQIREMLERQVVYRQRQAVRSQVLEKITESADWDLPEQLVMRQTDNALRREILEMQQAGYTRREISARENEIRQRAISTTRQALKEHFVLDRIATQEDIEVSPSDIETEIALMALQSGESPRRVRARLVKSGMIENLEAQIRERMAVDVVLEHAEYVDVPMDETTQDDVSAVRFSLCGTATGEATEEDEGEAET